VIINIPLFPPLSSSDFLKPYLSSDLLSLRSCVFPTFAVFSLTTLIKTINHQVFKLWRVGDMDAIHGFIDANSPQTAVVMGGGFVGLEMVEAFQKRGLKTTVVELMPTVMSIMDRGFGNRVGDELRANGVDVSLDV